MKKKAKMLHRISSRQRRKYLKVMNQYIEILGLNGAEITVPSNIIKMIRSSCTRKKIHSIGYGYVESPSEMTKNEVLWEFRYELSCPRGFDIGYLEVNFDQKGDLVKACFEDAKFGRIVALPTPDIKIPTSMLVTVRTVNLRCFLEKQTSGLSHEKIIRDALTEQFRVIRGEGEAWEQKALARFYSRPFIKAAYHTSSSKCSMVLETIHNRLGMDSYPQEEIILAYRVYHQGTPLCRCLLYYNVEGAFEDIVIKRE